MKDVQIKLRREECASSMGQSTNDAVAKVAQIKLEKEECATGTGQSTNDAVAKVAQIKLEKEECATGIGYIAMQTMQQRRVYKSSCEGRVCVKHGAKVKIKRCSSKGCRSVSEA